MSEDQVAMEMPLYQCHKKVHALEIKEVRPAYTDLLLVFMEAGYAPKLIKPAVFARGLPVPGDFYVVYEDGYESISPRKAFLDGYTPLAGDGATPDTNPNGERSV